MGEQLLCRYVAHLAGEGLSPKTIKGYLSAVRHLQISMHMPNPKIGDMSRLEQVVKGAKREFGKRGVKSRERLPMTPEILLKMKCVLAKSSEEFNATMIWAACCLCYFGFLRSGEISVPSEAAYDSGEHLNFGDVSVDCVSNPCLLRVKIKASKTDPFRKGVDIFVGKTANQLCPVSAMMAYLAKRGCKKGLLFRFEDNRLLTRERFVVRVKATLSAAGVDCKPYSGHSFRIGAATAAGNHGLPPATIKTLGRWESSAYMLYIRMSREKLAAVSKLICS